ncbi:MAG: hypothetical protein EB090_06955, partial [Verrucomicrobia bacterium]|nr:hypothetical protein [Verrucomicrobiota bacterium]
PYIVDESDAALLAMLEKMDGASVHGEAELTPALRDVFFPVLLGHPRVYVGRRKHLSVSRAAEGTRIKAELDDGGILHLDLIPAANGPEGSEVLEAGNGRWRLAGEQLELLDSLPHAYEGLRKGSRTVTREGLATFLQREMPQLERHVRVEPGERLKNLQFETMAPKIRVELDGLLSGVSCQLEAVYGNESHILTGMPGQPRGCEAVPRSWARNGACGAAGAFGGWIPSGSAGGGALHLGGGGESGGLFGQRPAPLEKEMGGEGDPTDGVVA